MTGKQTHGSCWSQIGMIENLANAEQSVSPPKITAKPDFAFAHAFATARILATAHVCSLPVVEHCFDVMAVENSAFVLTILAPACEHSAFRVVIVRLPLSARLVDSGEVVSVRN